MPEEKSIEPYQSSDKDDAGSPTGRVAEFRELLRSDRASAIEKLPSFAAIEKQRIFLELVALAAFEHSGLEIIRKEICDLPREWVLANIETAAEFQLMLPRDDGFEEFRHLFELYLRLDDDLAKRLAARMRQHSNPEIVRLVQGCGL